MAQDFDVRLQYEFGTLGFEGARVLLNLDSQMVGVFRLVRLALR